MLSGHTDVVPVDGQAWTVPPFRLTEADGRLYGRGRRGHEGLRRLRRSPPRSRRRGATSRTPLHLALSHDEEVGCLGVRSLIDLLAGGAGAAAMCIVGEPTGMAVATGHKGKRGLGRPAAAARGTRRWRRSR